MIEIVSAFIGNERTGGAIVPMLQKWKITLTGGHELSIDDPHITRCVSDIVAQAEDHWESMLKPGVGGVPFDLWEDIGGTKDSHLITVAYRRIRTMALAYAIKGSRMEGNAQLRDDIKSALDWMYEHRYRDGLQTYSNWWHWQIGAPLALNDDRVVNAYLTEYNLQ